MEIVDVNIWSEMTIHLERVRDFKMNFDNLENFIRSLFKVNQWNGLRGNFVILLCIGNGKQEATSADKWWRYVELVNEFLVFLEQLQN